jgi:serine/threonine protein kinase
MSMAQTTTEPNSSSEPRCPHCNAGLPHQATFCASCGERIVTKPVSFLLQDDADISTRYRVTSLVRRRPYVNLLLALDTQQSRPVAIRDIDITSLNEDGRLQACAIVQQEYDLLRRERIASIMPVIDVRHFKGHLYVVVGWPFDAPEKTIHLHTLQDVLQSGIGLPGTQTAFAWIEQLCASLAHLHSQHIVLGDLDPQTLILGSANYDGSLELMVSWLPPIIRAMLPDTSIVSNSSNYSAPEVFLGKPEPRSDVYSLGAILYILLTGVPPDEATARMHRRLRAPSEVNPRIHSTLDDFILKALALDSADRFQNMADMAEALAAARARKRLPTKVPAPMPLPPVSPPAVAAKVQAQHIIVDDGRNKPPTIDDIVNIDTVQVTSLPAAALEAWRAAPTPPVVASTPTPYIVEGAIEPQVASKEDIYAGQVGDEKLPVWRPTNLNADMSIPPVSTRGLRKRVTGLLPAISRPQSPQSPQSPKLPKAQPTPTRAVAIRPPDAPSVPEQRKSLLKQLQQFILGEQKHSTAAAAIIETPMRVQPQQTYAIRIQLMGRNTPESGQNGTFIGGLSALVEGQLVYIEVRSALYQNYAYIVQQATVQIPAADFAAEVTIPMKPLSTGPSGRRDRLHIFFMDEMRRPLYEKPFIIELFISHLVQPGREGHNVLTIPL